MKPFGCRAGVKGPRSVFRLVPFTWKPKAQRRREPRSPLPAPGAGLMEPRESPRPTGAGAGGRRRAAAGPDPGLGKDGGAVAADAGERVQYGGAAELGAFLAEEGCGEAETGVPAWKATPERGCGLEGQVQVGVHRWVRTFRRAPHARTANPLAPSPYP